MRKQLALLIVCVFVSLAMCACSSDSSNETLDKNIKETFQQTLKGYNVTDAKCDIQKNNPDEYNNIPVNIESEQFYKLDTSDAINLLCDLYHCCYVDDKAYRNPDSEHSEGINHAEFFGVFVDDDGCINYGVFANGVKYITFSKEYMHDNEDGEVVIAAMSEDGEVFYDKFQNKKYLTAKQEDFDKIFEKKYPAQSDEEDNTADVQEETTTPSQSEGAPTTGQRNALAKAEEYLDYSGFSKKSLKEQLEYEGFTDDEVSWAIKHVDVDWNAECAEKAQEYMDYSSFSRKGLKEQLEYEGFSDDQIKSGLAAVGY